MTALTDLFQITDLQEVTDAILNDPTIAPTVINQLQDQVDVFNQLIQRTEHEMNKYEMMKDDADTLIESVKKMDDVYDGIDDVVCMDQISKSMTSPIQRCREFIAELKREVERYTRLIHEINKLVAYLDEKVEYETIYANRDETTINEHV